MSAKAQKPAAITSTHLIKPETLAPSTFSLPKLPQKDLVKKEFPPVQLAMAEIVEQADEMLIENIAEAIVADIDSNYQTVFPVFLNENLKQAFHLFAEKLSPSLKPLIRLLEPEIIEQKVLVKLTAQQINMTEKIRVEWQLFLREYFNLNNLFLEIIENDEIDISVRMAYTAKEQLDEMVAENPDLLAMIQKFNLKIK